MWSALLPQRLCLDHASALSDARFGEVVEGGAVLCARSIKPLEGSRPWLRRTRVLWRLNGGRQRCRASPKLCVELGTAPEIAQFIGGGGVLLMPCSPLLTAYTCAKPPSTNNSVPVT